MGDLEYKQPAGVVSAVPDVYIRTVDLREDSFVIVGSDGIWGPLQDEEAVRIVAMALRSGGESAVKSAAQQLTEIAHSREPHDDKTAVIVFFGATPEASVVVISTPSVSQAVKMKPRHVAGANTADDMFAIAGQSKVDPKGDVPALDELDDLFSSYARDLDKGRT